MPPSAGPGLGLDSFEQAARRAQDVAKRENYVILGLNLEIQRKTLRWIARFHVEDTETGQTIEVEV